MLSRSAIQKGKRFTNFCNQQIEEMGLGKACPTPGSGSGKLKADSFNNLDFLLEYKNEENFPKQVLNNIKQAKHQAEIGNWNKDKWALIVRDPETPESNLSVYAIIDYWEFLRLLKKNSEPLIKKPDRELKWQIQRLVDTGKAVIKKLE